MAHFPASDGRPAWRVSVLTLFPDMFPGPLGVSLVGQALAAGLWSLTTLQIRDFGLGKHRQVDDTPAGGGAGMVLRADVLGLDSGCVWGRRLTAVRLEDRRVFQCGCEGVITAGVNTSGDPQ